MCGGLGHNGISHQSAGDKPGVLLLREHLRCSFVFCADSTDSKQGIGSYYRSCCIDSKDRILRYRYLAVGNSIKRIACLGIQRLNQERHSLERLVVQLAATLPLTLLPKHQRRLHLHCRYGRMGQHGHCQERPSCHQPTGEAAQHLLPATPIPLVCASDICQYCPALDTFANVFPSPESISCKLQ